MLTDIKMADSACSESNVVKEEGTGEKRIGQSKDQSEKSRSGVKRKRGRPKKACNHGNQPSVQSGDEGCEIEIHCNKSQGLKQLVLENAGSSHSQFIDHVDDENISVIVDSKEKTDVKKAIDKECVSSPAKKMKTIPLKCRTSSRISTSPYSSLKISREAVSSRESKISKSACISKTNKTNSIKSVKQCKKETLKKRKRTINLFHHRHSQNKHDHEENDISTEKNRNHSPECEEKVISTIEDGHQRQDEHNHDDENKFSTEKDSESTCRKNQINRKCQEKESKNYESKKKDPQKILKCEIDNCTYVNSHLSWLHSHMYHRHGLGEPTIECSKCDKKYFSDVQLKIHVRRKHCVKSDEIVSSVLLCSECGEELKSVSALNTHMLKAHSKGKLFKCLDCEFRSPRRRDLQSHILSSHGREPQGVRIFTCPFCAYKCIEKKRNEEHMARHTGILKHLCQLCGKSYTTERGLKTHMQYHSSQRPHKCEVCGASFKVRSKLNDHLRVTHTSPGIKPYQCAYCNHRSALRGNCNSHIKKSHPSLPVLVIDLFKDKRKGRKDYSWVDAKGSEIEEVEDASGAVYNVADPGQKCRSGVPWVIEPVPSVEDQQNQDDLTESTEGFKQTVGRSVTIIPISDDTRNDLSTGNFVKLVEALTSGQSTDTVQGS